jgi:DNA-binding MarR family transcriptional regulator
MIILCSPSSIIRPWINFEAGCAWIRKIPIINLCHSGVDRGDLPEPLSRFQNLNIEEDNFGQKLFKAIKKHLKLEIEKFPRIDNEAFKKELSAALMEISSTTAHVEPAKKKIDTAMVRLEEIEIKILKVLASEDGTTRFVGPHGFDAKSLASAFNITVTKMIHFLDKLASEQYVLRRFGAGDPRYALGSRGRAFLVENDLV